MGPVLVDTNLLLLLIVGSADRRYIGVHRNLSDYREKDFDILGTAISLFSDIVLVPHVLAEVSSLSRQIRNPARSRIQEKLKQLVETTAEISVSSLQAVRRNEFPEFGLTDAVLLHLCMLAQNGLSMSLLTANSKLAVQAEMLGHHVLNFCICAIDTILCGHKADRTLSEARLVIRSSMSPMRTNLP